MRVLALRGAHVIGTARTQQRGQEACASVQGRASPVVLELSDFDSVVACADEIRAFDTPIDALVCNAGNPAEPSPLQKDSALAARLWQVSEDLTRPYLS